MSPKAIHQAKRSGPRVGGVAAFERKRRASSSSVSSVSSVSSLEELSEEADSSDDDADDEEDRPLAQTSSHGRRRNNGRKTGHQPLKTKRRRVSDDEDSGVFDSSDSEDSSDDVYAGVDYITDAEDEDQDVEKLEEMMIMETERDHLLLPNSETHEQWHGAEIFGDSMLLPDASFFDEEQMYSAMDTFGETDMASEAVETPVARRVHFEERSDSSSDSDSHTEDEIPSDFLQQDSLDPQLRRMIESDNENHRHRRRQSEEVFGDADYGHANIYHVESEGTSEGSLSGYESMLTTCLFSFVPLLTHLQPMMVILQMKIFPLPPPLPTLAPFFAAIPPTRLSHPVMTRQTPSPVDVAQSWELSLRILTSLLPWLTAPANTWLSFPHMPLLVTIGSTPPPTVCPVQPTTALVKQPCN